MMGSSKYIWASREPVGGANRWQYILNPSLRDYVYKSKTGMPVTAVRED